MNPPTANQPFHFEHAGSHKPLAWPKYKLKECWTLVLCLLALRGMAGPVIIHNSWSTPGALHFTKEFRDKRASLVQTDLGTAPIVEPNSTGKLRRLVALVLSACLVLLPVSVIVALTRCLLPRGIGPLVVFCDGHLAGFALVLAARGLGAQTLTLQHGLYRIDDRGSIMGIRNFVADRICLWDARTEATFVDSGADPSRLKRVGQYGFTALTSEGLQDPNLILLCPPYDVQKIELFRQIEKALPEHYETRWSLHPMLRASHPDLLQATVADIQPRPAAAICGDSGALMDALAREIPIITIADRGLGTLHLTLEQAAVITGDGLLSLLKDTQNSLKADQCTFGFERAALNSNQEVY